MVTNQLGQHWRALYYSGLVDLSDVPGLVVFFSMVDVCWLRFSLFDDEAQL